MSKNYEDYTPIYSGPPRRRTNSALTFVKLAIVFVLVFALAVSAIYFVYLHNNDDGGLPSDGIVETLPPGDETGPEVKPPMGDDKPVQTEPPAETEDSQPTVKPEEKYTTVKLSAEEMQKGDLILVDSEHKVLYPEDDELVNLFASKTASYQISSMTMLIHKDIIEAFNKMMDDFVKETGNTDVIVWTSYRTKERQTEVYNQYVAQNGEESASRYVAKPDESDHNTGLGVALRVFRGGLSYQFSEVEDEYGWIKDNCTKYGFTERYPADKIEKTGLDYTTSFYLRYVGAPQAEIMKGNGFCLEEFLEFITEYEYGKNHFKYTSLDGVAYELYYVKCEEGAEEIEVPVPEDCQYTVSGDNRGGFIVTVQK